MKVNDLLIKYNIDTIPGNLRVNYMLLPKTKLKPSHENCELFNELYKCIISEHYNTIVRTPSGGISIKARNLRFPMYDIKASTRGIELTLLTGSAMCRIIFSAIPVPENSKVSGREAFEVFSKTCKKFGINIKDYRVDPLQGEIAKTEIKKPLIGLKNNIFKHMELNNVHHIDFHSSYPSGLVNTHPEFRPVIEYLYNHRSENNNYYKSVLTNFIGYMQSPYTKFAYAELARDAINDNYDRMIKLRDKLLDSDERVVISYNTDGIWYKGPIYHDEFEGETICTWANDHINTRFRQKSDGAYEYEENGKYHAVVRGLTELDRIKPREEWTWGDIYSTDANILKFRFIEGEGIVYEKTNEWERTS